MGEPLQKLKTIIVDDSLQYRQAVKSMLKGRDFIEVSGEASNGIEALKLVLALKPDLVLMDIQMPVLDGLNAAKKIKKIYPDIKIIILSVYKDPEYFEEYNEIGLDSYLIKGEDDKNLIEVIKKIFNL